MQKSIVVIVLLALPLVCTAQRPSLRELQKQGSEYNEEEVRRSTYNYDAAAAGYDRFTFEKFGVRFDYPEGWVPSRILASFAEDADVMGLQLDRIKAFHAPRILVDWGDYNTYKKYGNGSDTIDDIFERKFETIQRKEYTSFNETTVSVVHKERTTINGHDALRFRLDASFSGGTYVAQDEWIFIDYDDFVVEFGYQATPENFSLFYDKFTHLVESFTVTTPEVEHKYEEPKAKEEPQLPLRETQFSDVPDDAWYARDLLDARMAGWVSGYKDDQGNPLNRFGPADPVTVAEMLKMISVAKLFTVKMVVDPTDAQEQAIDHWSNEYVADALARNLISDSLRDLVLNHPDKPITRAETAEMTYGFFPIESMDQDPNDPKFDGVFLSEVPTFTDVFNHQFQRAIYNLVRVGIFTGDTDANGALTGSFRPNDTLNRAEALMIAVRSGDRNCLFIKMACPYYLKEN